MFIRKKIIKNKPYAYRVRNTWTKMGARQKVSSYLGRIYELNSQGTTYDKEYAKLSAYNIICSLAEWVLLDHGFVRKNNRLENQELFVSVRTAKVRHNKSKAVLYINGDYMCDYTLRKLLRFRSSKDKMEVGRDLAKAFISSGIPIPQEVFIHVFEQVFKEGQSFVK